MNLTLKPKTGMSRIFSDMLRPDSLFDRDIFDLKSDFFPMRLGMNFPSVNIREDKKEYVLELAAPGLERKDFNIEVENNTLNISVEKEEQREEGKQDGDYWRKEYSYNSFSRSFILPENVTEGNIDARYEKGVLMIHVPKAKETPAKPHHKIAVS